MIVEHAQGDNVCLAGLCTCRKEQEARMAETSSNTMIGPRYGKTEEKQPGHNPYRVTQEQENQRLLGAAEVRTTSATGGQKGTKLARFDLIPVGPLTELAKHFGRGAEKYDDNNWRKGYEWSKNYAALQRHLNAFWAGEDIDEETGSPHIIAAAWHCFALAEFAKTHPEYDDRSK